MKQEIGFEERKKIQLEMLDEIDAFCRANNIRYSIAFGTLLGAIRHKGFIPWDDDVDIMMPLPDLIRFKETFKSENLEYMDVDSNMYFEFPFSRVVNKKTYSPTGVTFKAYGICIDLYVIIGLPKDEDSFWKEAIKRYKIRENYRVWRSRFIRRFPIKSIPGFSWATRYDRDFLFDNSSPYKDATRFYILAGPVDIRHTMIYDRDIFTNIEDLRFEDRTYKAISCWDYFLNLRYGDYMKLPPKDQQVASHGCTYYWI